jgi:hypothetical protein
VNSHAEKPTLAEFAALNALSNNANLTALSFETADLSAVEYDIFSRSFLSEMICYCCHRVCVSVCRNRELWPDRSSLEPDFFDISISVYVT